jgi:hypothetical protein
MPDFTISLTSAQAQRVATAFSFLSGDGSNASSEQVIAWIRQRVKEVVKAAEQNAAYSAAEANVDAELDGEGW